MNISESQFKELLGKLNPEGAADIICAVLLSKPLKASGLPGEPSKVMNAEAEQWRQRYAELQYKSEQDNKILGRTLDERNALRVANVELEKRVNDLTSRLVPTSHKVAELELKQVALKRYIERLKSKIKKRKTA